MSDARSTPLKFDSRLQVALRDMVPTCHPVVPTSAAAGSWTGRRVLEAPARPRRRLAAAGGPGPPALVPDLAA